MSTQFTNRQWRLPNNENKDKQSNYSMEFDSDAIVFNQTTYSGAFSMSFWVNPVEFTTNNRAFLISENSNANFIWLFANNDIRLKINGSQYIFSESGGNDIVPSTWQNIIITRDNSNNVNCFRNGSSFGSSSTLSGGFVVNRFAQAYSGNWNYLGKLDGISIFNYALTDGTGGTVNQIAALYGSSSTGIGNPMTLNPVAYYPLGDQDAFNGSSYLTPNSSLKDFVFDFVPNDYIDCGTDSSLDITGNITLSGWINRDDNINSGVIISKWVSGSDTAYILRINSSGGAASNSQIQMLIRNTSGVLVTATENVGEVCINKWVSVVGTYDGSNIRIYYNGVELGAGTSQTGNIQTSTASLRIGSRGTEYIDSQMSNVSIWNTNLTSPQVTELYNNGTPSNLSNHSATSNLVSWWKLDASDTYDYSTGNWTIEDHAGSNDGTSSGMTQANLVQSDLSFTSGYSPYALDFDAASSDYIDVGTDSSLDVFGGDFSVSLWFKHTMSSGSARAMIEIGGYTNKMAITLGLSSNTGVGFAVDNNWNYNAGSGYNDGNWHHMVATRTSTTYKIYVDNTELSFSSGSYAYLTLNTIGKGKFGGYFNGSISNASIWNTNLTSAQVSEIYNEGVPSNL